MSRTRIKICGITRPEDGLAAVSAGVDAIGLVFYRQSPRAVGIEQAQLIVAALPPFVTVVGLFVDESAVRIREVCDAVPLSLLQFHGEELAAECESFDLPYIKAIRMCDDVDLINLEGQYQSAQGIILDTYKPGVQGGTGDVFDWKRVPQSLSIPIILAGGLDATNVAAAIEQTKPYGVDVSGGVEVQPGIKSDKKMQNFVIRVHSASVKN